AAFMADYEDNLPWEGEFTRYFPTYHDLNIRQLRGYFTWRAGLRHGDVRKTALSFAYIYLYELLNSVGVSSAEEALKKMQEFEASYLDVGYGDAAMRKNLHRWMLEFAVLHRLPREEVLLLQDAEILGTDRALLALRTPEKAGDEELLSAILFFLKPKAGETPVLTKSTKGLHLFTEVWRQASMNFSEGGRDLFTVCFGKRGVFVWHPLANAVWYNGEKTADTEYVLNECRRFFCKGGVWREERYESLYFDRERFRTLFRAADRMLRKYLKTGSYLKERPDEAWANPLAAAVITADIAGKEQAAHPEITIDFSGLAEIRRDAAVTRESLLTEEERGDITEGTEKIYTAALDSHEETPAESILELSPAALPDISETGESPDCAASEYLSPEDVILVRMLLKGEDPSGFLASSRRMPSLAADFINEALYDEIGDTVLEYDDGKLTIIEDYREDLQRLFDAG
ncbi:MAG: TerB N-terminal domain-containing protein, partial [Lachnospiraceae bacterium]|nr:TerB N-terminal domain-containing protein [Lachnospiraceae bacterium]